jgi:heme/copper-type cytochrome/quinol oxidase subunit 2
MLYGVAFVTIFVAAITSIFVARASAERGIAEDEAEQRIEARLEVIEAQLQELLRK